MNNTDTVPLTAWNLELASGSSYKTFKLWEIHYFVFTNLSCHGYVSLPAFEVELACP